MIFFFKNHEEDEVERLVTDLILFFKTALFEVYLNSPQVGNNKNNCINL